MKKNIDIFLNQLSIDINKYFDCNNSNVFRVKKTNNRDAFMYKLLLTRKSVTGQSVTDKINFFKGTTIKSKVSRVSLIERQQSIDVDFYKNLYKLISNKINKTFFHKQPKIYAGDGIYNNTYHKFGNGMMASKALSIGFFNCSTNMPVNLQLLNRKFEVDGLLKNMSLLSSKSIIILDIGYTSYNLFDTLIEHNIDFICRITKPIYVANTNKKYRYVKYEINEKEYYLMTSLHNENKFTSDILKELYHKRWTVEEYFKFIKLRTTYETIKQHNTNEIIKSTYCILIISQLIYLLSHVFSKPQKDMIVNKSSLMEGFYDHFLLRLIYNDKCGKKFNKSYIRSFIITYINLIKTVLDVSRPRVSKNTNSKWYNKSYQKGNYKK